MNNFELRYNTIHGRRVYPAGADDLQGAVEEAIEIARAGNHLVHVWSDGRRPDAIVYADGGIWYSD